MAKKLSDLVDPTLSRGHAAGEGLTLDSQGRIPYELLGTRGPSVLEAGQYMRWNGTDWVNVELLLGDVEQGGASTGEYLRWDGSDWDNSELLLADVEQGGAATGDLLAWTGSAWDDTTLGTLVAGDLLQWNGSAWEVVTTTGLASGDLLEWNGSDWVNKSPGTSNLAWTHFFSHTMGADAAEVEFTSIPQTWKHLKIMAQLGHSVGPVDVQMFVNDNNSGTDYLTQIVQAYASTEAAYEYIGTASSRIGAYGRVTSRLDTLELTFFDYTNTSLHSRWTSEMMRSDGDSSGQQIIERTQGLYKGDTAAITQVNIKPSSYSHEAGSTFDIYGIGDGT